MCIRDRSNIIPVLNAFSALTETAFQIRINLVAQKQVFEMLDQASLNKTTLMTIFRQSAKIDQQVKEIRKKVDSLKYPFAETHKMITMGEYLRPPILEEMGFLAHPVEYWAEAQRYIDDFFNLYTRMVSRIGSIVQGVEQTL